MRVPAANSEALTLAPRSDVRLPRRVVQSFAHPDTGRLSSRGGGVWADFAAPTAGRSDRCDRRSDQAVVDFLLGSFLGGAGIAIDAISGAMWQLEPDRVELRSRPE
jgi:hypothetical protein